MSLWVLHCAHFWNHFGIMAYQIFTLFWCFKHLNLENCMILQWFMPLTLSHYVSTVDNSLVPFNPHWQFIETLQCFAKQTAKGPHYEVNLGLFPIVYHRLKMQLRSWSLLSKNIKTGGFKNLKYIAVTSRTLKLQVFKVWQLRDLKSFKL